MSFSRFFGPRLTGLSFFFPAFHLQILFSVRAEFDGGAIPSARVVLTEFCGSSAWSVSLLSGHEGRSPRVRPRRVRFLRTVYSIRKKRKKKKRKKKVKEKARAGGSLKDFATDLADNAKVPA